MCERSAAALGADALGTWLWMPGGTVVETPSGSFQATPGLRLFPLGAMWSAYFVPAFPFGRRPKHLYVDITTPATRRGSLIEFLDLDLDVEQLDDGQVRVLDQDEFTTHSRVRGAGVEAGVDRRCDTHTVFGFGSSGLDHCQ